MVVGCGECSGELARKAHRSIWLREPDATVSTDGYDSDSGGEV